MSTTASLLVLGALSLMAPQEDGSTRAQHAQAAVVSAPRAAKPTAGRNAQRARRNPVGATNPQRVAPPSRVAPRVRLVPVPLNPTAPFWQAMAATGTSGLLGVANGGILPPAPSQMLSPGSLNVGVVMLDPASVPAGAPNTELFLIYRPHNPAGGQAPVLVHFHAYARSPADLIETDFLQEAMARDWYLVAPLQREPSAAPDDIHYSSVASQEYAKAAIDFTLAQPGTDPDRIFAYGFSMGGGAALNYAARHTALDDNRFAAIACHTGSLGLADVYDNVLGTAAEDHLEEIFGGRPSARPFEYLRSSVIELDGTGTAIMGGLHTVHNVAHLPIRVHFATQDPNQYLVEQARQFEAVLSNISAPIYQVFEDQLVTTHTWQLLNAAQTYIDFNTLTVLHRHNSDDPLRIYRFLKKIGSRHQQFIPIVERAGIDATEAGLELVSPAFPGAAEVTDWSLTAEQYGHFLVTVFDEWVRHDVGRIYIQLFDSTLSFWAGHGAELCIFTETCGLGLAMEHNGDLYACDHYVYPDYRLGNVLDGDLADIVADPRQTKFGRDKAGALTAQCRSCEVRPACNGGCPKHRIARSRDGEPGQNHFCEAYYRFFTHVRPYMTVMTDELRQGRAPANVMAWAREKDQGFPGLKIGRNDPCVCGSGKKFKKCCGANRASG